MTQKVWKALCEDISLAAGGPMGSPVKHVWTRCFANLTSALEACEKHHGKKVAWKCPKTDVYRSGDLGTAFTYEISLLDIEE